MQAIITTDTKTSFDFITNNSSYESEISYGKSDISSYDSDADYDKPDTYYDDDEFSTNESFQSEDSYDSDEEKEKQSLLKRLKATYNPQSFIRGFITVKLSTEDFDVKNKKRSANNIQPLEDKRQDDSLVEKKKKRVRKNKLQAEKSTAEITTKKISSQIQTRGPGKYGVAPKKPVPLCEICLEPLYGQSKPLVYHDQCFTWFHKGCMKAHIDTSIESSSIPIKCPQEGCNIEFEDKRIVQMIGKNEFASYLKKAKILGVLANLEKFVFCATPDCSYVFELITRDSGADLKLDCPDCGKSTCASCRIPFHKMLTCAEYHSYAKDELAVIDMMGNMKLARCQKCKFWVEKNLGCNHITCRCSNQFCYLCSKPWKTCTCP